MTGGGGEGLNRRVRRSGLTVAFDRTNVRVQFRRRMVEAARRCSCNGFVQVVHVIAYTRRTRRPKMALSAEPCAGRIASYIRGSFPPVSRGAEAKQCAGAPANRF
jgi:hypothetical protein